MESKSLDCEFKKAIELISKIYGVPVKRIDELLTMERDYIALSHYKKLEEANDGK